MFSIFGRLSARLASIPYALVGLFARIVVAYPFFMSGQSKIEGAKYGTELLGQELSFKLPQTMLDKTFELFANDYKLPVIPSNIAAYLVAFAENVLPVLILFGLATRLSALGLFIMVLVIQLLVFPGHWWSEHAYWLALLLLLMSRGAGAISLDAFFGLFRRKPKAQRGAPPMSAPEVIAPAVKV